MRDWHRNLETAGASSTTVKNDASAARTEPTTGVKATVGMTFVRAGAKSGRNACQAAKEDEGVLDQVRQRRLRAVPCSACHPDRVGEPNQKLLSLGQEVMHLCGFPCITVPRRESVAEWPSFPRSLYARILRLIATHFPARGCYTEMQLRLKDVDVRESDHLMKPSWLTPLHCAAPYQGPRLQPRLPVCHHRVRVPHHPGEQAAEFRDPSCTR